MNTQPEKVIVFCPNWVGDVVMSTPVFSCLRHNFPKAEITGVIRKYARGVIEDGPWFDNIIDDNDKTSGGFLNIVKRIRNIRPDIAVLLRNSFGSALMARLGSAKKIYGYKRDGRSFLLTGGPEPVRDKNGIRPLPMGKYYMELCRFMDLRVPDETRPGLYISEELSQKGDRLLEKYSIRPGDMVIGMNPGAKFGSSKCWPTGYFAKLAELFEEKWACRTMLFAGPGEDDIAGSIVQQSSAKIINTAPDRVDLALLKHMVKRCSLLVTNDTGTRHYAVAFGVPVVVIMGPTDARYTAANLEKTVVLQKKMECSPCHEKKCPLGHHNCMKMITPEDVLNGSVELMEKQVVS